MHSHVAGRFTSVVFEYALVVEERQDPVHITGSLTSVVFAYSLSKKGYALPCYR